tara:strand:+ start:3886 stop:4701 length:816 start_codon:yes stop_codon:yes gene_type:complete
MNKILVGVITNQVKDYCWDKFSNQLKGLQQLGHDVLIIDNSPLIQPRKGFDVYHYRLWNKIFKECALENLQRHSDNHLNGLIFISLDCMNILRDKFLEGDYTHLFILESDVFIEQDTVQRLLDMDADIANFTYLMNLNRFNDLTLCVQSTKDSEGLMLNPEQSRELINSGIKELGKDMLGDRMITGCGYGCTLVKRKVLEDIKFRIGKSKEGVLSYPDSIFHPEAISKGYTNKLDTDWLPVHENLNNQTMDMLRLLKVQNNTTRRERRATK